MRTLDFIEEPLLEFGYGQVLAYPRDGLFLFGPVQDKIPLESVRFGVIGTSEGLRRFNIWSKRIRGFIPTPAPRKGAKLIEPHHIPFPGFEQTFHARWPMEPQVTLSNISEEEISEALRLENRYEAIKTAVSIYSDRLIEEQLRLENPPNFWFVVIPEEVYRLGRPESRLRKEDRIPGSVTVTKKQAQEIRDMLPIFPDELEQAKVYRYARHFRRQLKARLLQNQIVTQIVRETTLTPEEFLREDGFPVRRVEDPATVAWKLCTAAYYKSGGKPWQLADVRPNVCYVGLVYKRTDPESNSHHACCAAQMFLTAGDGVVFRGALGPWYSPDMKQFHLDKSAAASLIGMVVGEYERVHGTPPSELFIHARARFSDDEWEGFEAACPDSTALVGVQIYDARSDLKLFRSGAYPVIRGTALKVDVRSAYLWTSGYVPRLDTYMGPETPNPILVRIHRGTRELDVVLHDIMGLTKINFNSCLFNDRLPVTIRFANAVGDVLISAPIEGEPILPFKFYI